MEIINTLAVNPYKYVKLKWWDYKNPRPERLSGVDVFCADIGQGKTVAMTYMAYMYADMFGAEIWSNYGIQGEHGKIETVEDMIRCPSNSIICIDEINNVMNAQMWKETDPAIFSLLTQSRHSWKKVLATAQNYDEMHIGFRRHANLIIDVKNIGGRWFFLNGYNRKDFVRLERVETQSRDSEYIEEWKHGAKVWSHNFVATNELFNSYDTYAMVNFLTKSKTDVAEANREMEKKRVRSTATIEEKEAPKEKRKLCTVYPLEKKKGNIDGIERRD